VPEVLSTWAVVVAGGAGERLGADRAKAYVRFGERTLLAASLELFEHHDAIDGIVCVVPEGYEERTTLLADDLALSKLAAAVVGGPTRARSVALGIAEVPDRASFVLVHDAARPLASPELIDRVLDGLAGGADGVVPGLPVVDTLKRVEGGRIVDTVERGGLVGVQTPQGFVLEVLRDAYQRLDDEAIDRATDCSSIVELAGGGGRIVWVAGERDNLKVTTQHDLERARALLAARSA
jgi:2-C-methyl-D-erythritol 4-phosphate cytidylyltransferase